MTRLKKLIITSAFFCVALASAEKSQAELEEIINHSSYQGVNFHPDSLVSLEHPGLDDQVYTYIECDRVYDEDTAFSCHITLDDQRSNMESVCQMDFNKTSGEAVDSVSIKTLSHDNVIVSYVLSKVAPSKTHKYVQVIEYTILKIHVVNTHSCMSMNREIAMKIEDSDPIIVPYNSTFDVIAKDQNVPLCKQEYCLFSFHKNGKKLREPIKLLPGDVPTEQFSLMQVYPVHTKSSHGYFVLAERQSEGSNSLIVLFRPIEDKVHADGYDHAFKSTIQLSAKSNGWNVNGDRLLNCLYGNQETEVICDIYNVNMTTRTPVTFKFGKPQKLNQAHLLPTGEVFLWTREKLDDNTVRHSIHNNKGLYHDEMNHVTLTQSICYPGYEDSESTSYHVYESLNQVCISTYCNSFREDHYASERKDVNKFYVKCIDKSILL